MQFWLLADNFEHYWDETNPKQRQDDALGMYNRFISLEAPEPLGVRCVALFAVVVDGHVPAVAWRPRCPRPRLSAPP